MLALQSCCHRFYCRQIIIFTIGLAIKKFLDSFYCVDILALRFGALSVSIYTGNLNPKVLLELFSMYREWQEEKAKKISEKQVPSRIM